ncbi:MAG: bifunctional serine/threonine-protein kinase/formylglycine-generating enzyme family protein [Gammaproteobacteria bacterium]
MTLVCQTQVPTRLPLLVRLEGSVIKQRFKLEKVLGIGGMGKVYRALDLLKAEAKDKKPHVAIKLLNDDFKDHPEAFISLQRESSRQQKLAHPNIATIYDFDRVGGPNTPVFITMELMEGMELKDYIKKKVRPKGGLDFDEAYDIIKQLGAGLIYAHERNLVHSDFKPGNAFMCDDGTVKTLDFGIARAVKNPVTGEAEKTLFDPGKLGALTPAYASLEMLEGEEPDTRDDIYALGCTAYELLTTKHPFNKLPANKAKENNLVAPYIKKLNKKQNRALRRSIAFNREDRSPNVAHFLEEFEGKATWYKNPFVIAASVLLIISLMLFAPAMDYLHQQKLEGMIADLSVEQISTQDVANKLDEILLLEPADRSTVTGDDKAKEAIHNYFSDKVAGLIDTSGQSYDFPAADDVIAEITQFYPDSIFLQEQTALVSAGKKQIIGELNTQYIAALNDPSLVDNTKNILQKIKGIDPTHPLLEDPRPSNAYRIFALDKFNEGNFDAALELVRSGLALSKNSPRLQDLENKILNAQKVAKLESDIQAVQGQLNSLTDYKGQEAAIVELATLKPDSEIINALSLSFTPLVDTQLNTILNSGTRDEAITFASEFGELMSGFQLNKQLTEVKLAHLSGDARKQAVAELVSADVNNIETALANAEIGDAQWETSLLKNIQELETLVNDDDSIEGNLILFRSQIAEIYTAKANEALITDRFDAADDFINVGVRLAPGFSELSDMQNTIANAREESERIARVEANKSDFITYTDADNITDAYKVYDKLKQDLSEIDDFISFQAPQMLADSYARIAQKTAATKDYKTAYSFVTKGLELDPTNVTLDVLQTEYQAEANIIELTELFESGTSFPKDIRLKISQIETTNPARYAEFSKASAKILIDRISDLRSINENAAAGLAQTASILFPADATLANLRSELQLQPWPGIAEAQKALKAGNLTLATELKDEAASEYSTYPDYAKFVEILDKRIEVVNAEYNAYLEDKVAAGENYDDLRVSKRLFQRLKNKWLDNPDYEAEEKDLNKLIAKHKPSTKSFLTAETGSLDAIATASSTTNSTTSATGSTARVIETSWEPVVSDSECTGRLAGYGKRAKAVCFDMIHAKARGPLMVVIPDGEEMESPFAISKYEISISDWSKYCILSGACQPIKDKALKNDPITNISIQQVEEYTAWLSKRTGKTYRLPTNSEWEYAANAAGKQPKKDYNCQVKIQEKLIKGTGVVSVKSGKSNGWGLKNYIGNVQEWVNGGSETVVRGGAYTDPHAKCEIAIARNHNGAADEITGFRLIREDIL